MPEEGDRAAIAAQALAAAKADALARGERPQLPRSPRRGGWQAPEAGQPGSISASSAVRPAAQPDGGTGGAAAGAAITAAGAGTGGAAARAEISAAGRAGTAGAGTASAAADGAPAVAAGPRARALPPRAAKRQRRDDPAPLRSAIDGLITDSGWGLAAATGSVFGRWAQIVGPDLAAHTTPDRLDDGELVVMADSTAWATQVRLLAGELVRRLNTELGTGTVRRVRVLGPVAASRRPGQWRVKGGRGPRDTYG